MIYTNPIMAICLIVVAIVMVWRAMRWLRREANGENYQVKYPHAAALHKAMSDHKVDAADAAEILGIRASKE